MYVLKYHRSLASHWHEFTRAQRILSIASELQRAKNMLAKDDCLEAKNAYERAFELLDLTISLVRSHSERYELLRFREMMAHLYLDEPDNLDLLGKLLNVLLSLDKDAYKILNAYDTRCWILDT